MATTTTFMISGVVICQNSNSLFMGFGDGGVTIISPNTIMSSMFYNIFT